MIFVIVVVVVAFNLIFIILKEALIFVVAIFIYLVSYQGRSTTPFAILAFTTFGSKVVVYATPLDFNIVEV